MYNLQVKYLYFGTPDTFAWQPKHLVIKGIDSPTRIVVALPFTLIPVEFDLQCSGYWRKASAQVATLCQSRVATTTLHDYCGHKKDLHPAYVNSQRHMTGLETQG